LNDEAVDLYLKAVDKDPRFEKGWARLGRLFLDKSLRSYRKALELNSRDEKIRELIKRLSPKPGSGD